MALHIKVTSPTTPGVTSVAGGTIAITGVAPDWELKSTDTITAFKMSTNKADITKIEIVAEDLTSLNNTFYKCGDLTDFLVYGPSCFSNVTDFYKAWYECSKLISFPMIDTSKGTDFGFAWFTCKKLTSFPLIDTSKATRLASAWGNCLKLTSFPLINTSACTTLNSTWLSCKELTAFPKIDTSSATDIYFAWGRCSKLTAFPDIDTSAVTHIGSSWRECKGLISFPLLDTSNITTFPDTWNGCINLTSFPSIDTSNATGLVRTWMACSSLTSFPLINTSKSQKFVSTWDSCTKLKCLAGVDTTLSTDNNKIFSGTSLCRPNATEQAAIVGSGGLKWVNDVPATEDCCVAVAKLGTDSIKSCYLGSLPVDSSFMGSLGICRETVVFEALVFSPQEDEAKPLIFKNASSVDVPYKIKDNGDGSFRVTSAIPVHEISWQDAGVTKFHVIKGDTVGEITNAWKGCSDLIEFKGDGLTNIVSAVESWKECSSLNNFDTRFMNNVTNVEFAWGYCSSMDAINTEGLTSAVNIHGSFRNSAYVTFDTIHLTSAVDAGGAWSNWNGLTATLTSFDSSGLINVENLDSAFYNCFNLNYFDTPGLDNVKNINNCWAHCENMAWFNGAGLNKDIDNWGENGGGAFHSCYALSCISEMSTVMASYRGGSYLFYDCGALMNPTVSEQDDLANTGLDYINAAGCP